ncbi:MAG TPA: SpoIIE family protein phosphatase [Pyrinomonadaceae bacterium]
MKKRTLLYIPALILFVFALLVLLVHFSWMIERQRTLTTDVAMPFNYNDGQVRTVYPEAEALDIKPGDKITVINGREFSRDAVWREELANSKERGTIDLVMQRKTPDGQTETRNLTVPLVRVEKNFGYYTTRAVGFTYTYFVPAFCIFVGFWVVFVRVHDPLAWLLLLIMLGFACIGLEGYGPGNIIGTFTQIFFSTWALAMFLFGVYFPERLSLDVKFPWLKWVLIVPFGFQIVLGFLGILKTFTGSALFVLPALDRIFDVIVVPLNALGIGMFFACLGYKSGTLQNLDARRRLKLMVYGTSIAMLPSFLIILYGIFAGIKGSFFDRAPAWFAFLALALMLVFPLTMAYVIIVHRAMDVSVVIRQGLQYAFARGGVRILQLVAVVAVILGVIWIFRSDRFRLVEQVGFVAGGFALVPLIDYAAKNLRVWIDRKFFREAYNAEQILSELSEDVRTMVETKPLLETVSTRIAESLHVPQIALLLKNGNNEFQPAYALGYENPPLEIEFSEADKTVEKLRRNEPLTIYQDDEDSWINDEIEKEEREKLQKLNSQLLLPIGAKDSLSGVISLSPKRSEEPYTPNDLRLLKSVAAQTAVALENSRLTEAIAREAAQKERLNRELEIAREVQERLFPQELPPTEGLDYTGACRPALGVGGDYYDFLELPEGKFGIAIGDVSGKGIGASLMMASLQASLRGQAIHCGSNLAELMKHVNTLVYDASTSNRYATFFYAQLDTRTRKLTYVNAGHNPPFVLRKNGDVLRLEEGGAVVGMLPSMFVNYTQGDIELEAGDVLVGFTDGISEAMNPAEEEWGEDAMLEELKNVYELPAEEILNHIVVCADRFANGAKQHDDMTMIIIKII